MVIKPITGTEWDHKPFDSTNDSDLLSHINDLAKFTHQELLYVRKLLKKFNLKQRGNIVLLTTVKILIRGFTM